MEIIDEVFLGTTVKIAANAIGTPSVPLSECGFELIVWTAPKNDYHEAVKDNAIVLSKEQCIKQSDDSYLAEIPTSTLGKGYIICRMVMRIPDSDCAAGFRQEVLQGLTNIKVI